MLGISNGALCMTTQALPLKGIRVIDYSHFLAGPYMGRCLAAMGAEVIKVERPTAGDAGRAHAYFVDGQSGYFLQQNMGKQGLCINLKDPRGLAMMHKLTDTADVFLENYRPGALNKLGLGYQELSQRNLGSTPDRGKVEGETIVSRTRWGGRSLTACATRASTASLALFVAVLSSAAEESGDWR